MNIKHMVQGYCFKEKKRVNISNPKYQLNARGSPVVSGTCPSCNGKVFTLVKMSAVPDDIKNKLKVKKGSGTRKRTRKSRANRN